MHFVFASMAFKPLLSFARVMNTWTAGFLQNALTDLKTSMDGSVRRQNLILVISSHDHIRQYLLFDNESFNIALAPQVAVLLEAGQANQ